MLTGAFWALWSLRRSLWSAVRSGLKASGKNSADTPHTERDLPMGAVLIGIALFVVPLFLLYYAVVGSIGVSLAMAVIMIVAGFLFSSVSGYMAGLVGSSNNPVSGITICTILFASLVLMWMVGGKSAIGAVAVVLIGAVVCNAAAVAGDNLQDLKAGHIVGSTPWRQQVMQVMLCVGVLASAAVMAPVMNVLLFAYGIGEPAHPGVLALPAPQANLVKSVAEGMFRRYFTERHDCNRRRHGRADHRSRFAPRTNRIALECAGAGGRRGDFPPCPLDVSTPILAGGLVAEAVAWWHAGHSAGGDRENLKQNGTLFCRRTHYRRGSRGDFHRDVYLGEQEPGYPQCRRRNTGRKMVGGGHSIGNLLLDLSRRHPAPRDVKPVSQQPSHSMRVHPRHPAKLVLCLGTVYLVWGSSFLFSKIAVNHLPPAMYSGIRFVTAGVLLALVARFWRGDAWPGRLLEWRHVLIAGFFMVFVSNGLNVWAIRYIPTNESALLNGTAAFWIAGLGVFGRRGHPLTRSAILGLAIGFLGTALMLVPKGDLRTSGLLAQFGALFACFAWALGTLYYRSIDTQLSSLMFMALQMFLGGLMLLSVAMVHGDAARWTTNAPGMIALCYLTFFSSCLAYTAYGWLSLNATPPLIGTYSYVNPAIAAYLGWQFLTSACRDCSSSAWWSSSSACVF